MRASWRSSSARASSGISEPAEATALMSVRHRESGRQADELYRRLCTTLGPRRGGPGAARDGEELRVPWDRTGELGRAVFPRLRRKAFSTLLVTGRSWN